jgi:hypothetical protein
MYKLFINKKIRLLRAIINKGNILLVLEKIILSVMVFLVILTSIAVFKISIDCFKYKFDLGLNELLFYISNFKPIFELLAGTLVMIGLFVAVERVNLMSEANDLKASELWKKKFFELINDLRINNPPMAIYFEESSDKIYRYLYKRNFLIYNKLMLRIFMWKFIDSQTIYFEVSSKIYTNNQKKYQTENEVCSIEEIKKIAEFIFRFSHIYETLMADFEDIYKSNVKPFARKNLV